MRMVSFLHLSLPFRKDSFQRLNTILLLLISLLVFPKFFIHVTSQNAALNKKPTQRNWPSGYREEAQNDHTQNLYSSRASLHVQSLLNFLLRIWKLIRCKLNPGYKRRILPDGQVL